MGHTNLGNEVCLCGKKAIKWKWSSWVCERCDALEKMDLKLNKVPRKDRGTGERTPTREEPLMPIYYSVNLRGGSL